METDRIRTDTDSDISDNHFPVSLPFPSLAMIYPPRPVLLLSGPPQAPGLFVTDPTWAPHDLDPIVDPTLRQNVVQDA